MNSYCWRKSGLSFASKKYMVFENYKNSMEFIFRIQPNTGKNNCKTKIFRGHVFSIFDVVLDASSYSPKVVNTTEASEKP